jgi:hypothetical protein
MRAAFLLVFIVGAPVQAGDPDWVTQYGKSSTYPPAVYLTGFGTAPAKEKDALQIAEDNARANLARTISVTIQSNIVDKLEEQGKKASQYFSAVTQSSTSLNISGVKTEVYKKDKTVYVLAYVNRAELKRIYEKKKTDLTQRIRSILGEAARGEADKKIDAAAALYLSLFPLIDEWKETECILLVAGGGSAAEIVTESPTGKTEIASKIDQLLAQSITSIDDAARAIAYQLSKQMSEQGKTLVSPLTYQDSRLTSPFSRYFQQILETQLQKFSVWDIAQQARGFVPKSSEVTRDFVAASGAGFLFEGNYWEQGPRIKIIGRMREAATGRIAASAEVSFDSKLVDDAGLSIKPENYLTVLTEQKAFRKDEIVSSDIQLEVWTDKGTDPLFYTEGEIMKVYVRVNRASHIRILYNFADGSRTLLFNDHYIDESKANQVVEIPGEFECVAPFGGETLIVVARTEPFPKLPTVERDGIQFLEEKDPGKAGYAVRGFKKKEPSGDAQQTERRLTITTMAK